MAAGISGLKSGLGKGPKRGEAAMLTVILLGLFFLAMSLYFGLVF